MARRAAFRRRSTKLAEGDDIKDYLTTYERLMTMHHVDKAQWVAKLAPQLSGRALQAYAAMPSSDSLVYVIGSEKTTLIMPLRLAVCLIYTGLYLWNGMEHELHICVGFRINIEV